MHRAACNSADTAALSCSQLIDAYRNAAPHFVTAATTTSSSSCDFIDPRISLSRSALDLSRSFAAAISFRRTFSLQRTAAGVIRSSPASNSNTGSGRATTDWTAADYCTLERSLLLARSDLTERTRVRVRSQLGIAEARHGGRGMDWLALTEQVRPAAALGDRSQ